MGNAYPIELRECVVAAYERGDGSYVSIGLAFRVGQTTVKRWVSQQRREGHLTPQKRGGGRRSDVSLMEIEVILSKRGDANAGEIAAAYKRERRGKARRHVSSIKRALYRGGYVVKKTPTCAGAVAAGCRGETGCLLAACETNIPAEDGLSR